MCNGELKKLIRIIQGKSRAIEETEVDNNNPEQHGSMDNFFVGID